MSLPRKEWKAKGGETQTNSKPVKTDSKQDATKQSDKSQKNRTSGDKAAKEKEQRTQEVTPEDDSWDPSMNSKPPVGNKGAPPRGRGRGFRGGRGTSSFQSNEQSDRGRRGNVLNGPSRGRGNRGRIQTRGLGRGRATFRRPINTWDPQRPISNTLNHDANSEDWDNEEYTGSLANSQIYTSSRTSNTPPVMNNSVISGSNSSTSPSEFETPATAVEMPPDSVKNDIGLLDNQFGVKELNDSSNESVQVSPPTPRHSPFPVQADKLLPHQSKNRTSGDKAAKEKEQRTQEVTPEDDSWDPSMNSKPPVGNKGAPPRGRGRGFRGGRGTSSFQSNEQSDRGRRGNVLNGPSRGRGNRGRIQTRGLGRGRATFRRPINTWDPQRPISNTLNHDANSEDWDNEEYTGSLANSQIYTSSGTSNTPPVMNNSVFSGSNSSTSPSEFEFETTQPNSTSPTFTPTRISSMGENTVVANMPPGVLPHFGAQYIMGQGGIPYFQQPMFYNGLQLIPQQRLAHSNGTGYYVMGYPTSTMTEGVQNNMNFGRFSSAQNTCPVQASSISQQGTGYYVMGYPTSTMTEGVQNNMNFGRFSSAQNTCPVQASSISQQGTGYYVMGYPTSTMTEGVQNNMNFGRFSSAQNTCPVQASSISQQGTGYYVMGYPTSTMTEGVQNNMNFGRFSSAQNTCPVQASSISQQGTGYYVMGYPTSTMTEGVQNNMNFGRFSSAQNTCPVQASSINQQVATKVQPTQSANPSSDSDLVNIYSKSLSKSYEKQGFHCPTPPPFNLGSQNSGMGPGGGYTQHPFIPAMTPHHNTTTLMHQPIHQSTEESYLTNNVRTEALYLAGYERLVESDDDEHSLHNEQ